MVKRLLLLWLLAVSVLWAQQPQTSNAPVVSTNSKYTQGVGPGYWPQLGTGLNLILTAGSVVCNGTTPTTYAGGTLVMAPFTTNYVQLNSASACAPFANTTGFLASNSPIATVVTNGVAITQIRDFRPMGVGGGGGSGGVVWPSPVVDQGGQLYNVKAYGALGNGINDDLTGVNATIALCNTNGGTVFFPVGTYLLSTTPTAITNRFCNVLGTGRASTLAFADGNTGLALLKFQVFEFDSAQHNQFLRDLSLNCNSSNPASGTGRQNNGLWLYDTLMVKTQNVAIYNCTNSVLQQSHDFFEERNTFLDVTLENFTSGFVFQQDAGDSFNSFDHNNFTNIFFNTYLNGDSVFHLTGGASVTECAFNSIQGNFGPGGGNHSNLFLLDDGSALVGPTITALPETNSGTSYLFYAGTDALSATTCGNVHNCVSQGTGSTLGISFAYGGGVWATQTFTDFNNQGNFLATPSFAGPGIILDNPNFILTTSGWTTGPAGLITVDTTTSPFTNGSSLKFTTASALAGVQTQRSYAAYGGESMTLTGYMKADGVFEAQMAVAALDGQGNLLSYPITMGFTTSGTWTQYTATGVMPANTAYVYVLCTRQDSNGGQHSGWFTNISLRAALDADVVRTGQNNTYTTGVDDFRNATHLYVPAVAAAVGATNGEINFDLTNLMYHGFPGGTAHTFMTYADTVSWTNGDCAQVSKVGSFVSFVDAGGSCGGGGGGGVSTFSSGNIPGFATVAIATPSTTPAQTFTLISAAQNLAWMTPNGSSGIGGYRAIVGADIPTLNQNTSGNAATATAFDHTPTQCGTLLVSTGIAASGAANCFPTLGTIRPPAGAPVVYAAFTGVAGASALSWGEAEVSVMGAYDVLPTSGGTIYMSDGGSSANALRPCPVGEPAGCGILIAGPTDPNYAAIKPGTLTLTAAANASAGNTVYTGTITPFATLCGGHGKILVAGFATSANNGYFDCVSGTSTTLTVANASGVAETHAGTAQLASWRRWKNNVNFVGVGGSIHGPQAPGPQVGMLFQGSDQYHPPIWLSDTFSYGFYNIAGGFPWTYAYVGLGSDFNYTTGSPQASWDNVFSNVYFRSNNTNNGSGPPAVINTNSNFNQFINCQFSSNTFEAPKLTGCSRSGSTSTCTIFNAGKIATVVLGSSGGTSYTVGDVLTIVQGGASGGTATVLTAPGGVVATVSLTSIGTGYAAGTSSNLATTGGTGTGALLTITTPIWPTNWNTAGTLDLSITGPTDPSFATFALQATIASTTTFTYTNPGTTGATSTGGYATSPAGHAAVVNPKGLTQGGAGFILFQDDFTIGGGFLYYPGTGGSTVWDRRHYAENLTTPGFRLTGTNTLTGNLSFETQVKVDTVYIADNLANPVPGFAYDNGTQASAPNIVGEMTTVSGPVTMGPGAAPYITTILPTTVGATGSYAGQSYLQTDESRMTFGPTALPGGNVPLTLNAPATWNVNVAPCGSPNTAGTPTPSPEVSTTTASLVAPVSGGATLNFACMGTFTKTPAVGDAVIIGGFFKSVNANGYKNNTTIQAAFTTATFASTTTHLLSVSPQIGGAGEWQWGFAVSRLATVGGGSEKMAVQGYATQNQPAAFYGTTVLYIPATAGITDNQLAVWAKNLQYLNPTCAAGQVCLPPGDVLKADSAAITQVIGNASTSTAFDHTPTLCAIPQLANGILASGAANCIPQAETNFAFYNPDTTGGIAVDAAFQTAINTLTATGGGTLHVGPGNYRFNSGVSVPSAVWIKGEGTVGGGPGGALGSVQFWCGTSDISILTYGPLVSLNDYSGGAITGIQFVDKTAGHTCGMGNLKVNRSYVVEQDNGYFGFSEALVAAPTTPALTPSTSGGSLPAATYFVAIEDTDALWRETLPSTATSVVVGGSGSGSIALASHTSAAPMTFYNVFIGASATTMHLVKWRQASASGYTITTTAPSGLSPEVFNTTGGACSLSVGTSGNLGLVSGGYANQNSWTRTQEYGGNRNCIVADRNNSNPWIFGGNFNGGSLTNGYDMIVSGGPSVKVHTESGGSGRTRVGMTGPEGDVDIYMDLGPGSGAQTGVQMLNAWNSSVRVNCAAQGATQTGITADSGSNGNILIGLDNLSCGNPLVVDNSANGQRMIIDSEAGRQPGARIAFGSQALGTSAISSGACATTVTVGATGVKTTDILHPSFNVDPTAITGYGVSTSGLLSIYAFPTANNVNFRVCNSTASSITPGALTLNWQVIR